MMVKLKIIWVAFVALVLLTAKMPTPEWAENPAIIGLVCAIGIVITFKWIRLEKKKEASNGRDVR